jgi:hypothetical protein
MGTFIGERGERDYVGRLFLCVDSRTALILPPATLEARQLSIEGLIETIQVGGVYPAGLTVTSELLFTQLGPIAGAPGIKVRMAKRLPALDRVERELTARFR